MELDEKIRQLNMPYEEKLQRSKELILEWYLQYNGEVYVSFSGGKDSTALLHLARSIKGCGDIKGCFIDTGLEYPEIRDFVKTTPNVDWIKPKLNFKQVVEKYGYPIISKEQSKYIYDIRHGSEHIKEIRTKGYIKNGKKSFILSKKWRPMLDADFEISDRCCYVMKKATVRKYEKETGLKPMIGMMAAESRLRYQAYIGTNCNAFQAKHPVSHPIMFWNEQDILRYLTENKIEIASIYGEIKQDDKGNYYTTGVHRTGCMFCMYGVHLEGHPNRFEKMKETHPKQYEYIMNKLNGQHILDEYLKCAGDTGPLLL